MMVCRPADDEESPGWNLQPTPCRARICRALQIVREILAVGPKPAVRRGQVAEHLRPERRAAASGTRRATLVGATVSAGSSAIACHIAFRRRSLSPPTVARLRSVLW